MLWLWIALIFAIFLVKVVNMEADILKALRFELGGPTVKTFLRCVFLCWLYDLVALVYFVLVVLSWLFVHYLLFVVVAGGSVELVKRALM